MKKETVTLDQIKKDAMKYIRDYIFGRSFTIFYIWLCFFAIDIFCKNVIEKKVHLSIPLIEIATILFLLCEICFVIYAAILYARVKRLEFTIRTDVLVIKTDCKSHIVIGSGGLHSYTPHCLLFNYGHYYIPARRHYQWSTLNSMNEKDVYSTSCIRDTFTLVELDDKMLVVYNHRFFDVQYPET